MKKLDENLIKTALSQRLSESVSPMDSPQTAEKSGRSSPLAQRFWIRMTELYGDRWARQYGDAPTPGIWTNLLESLPPQIIARGLEVLTTRSTPFPPSVGEFMGCCREGCNFPSAREAFRDAAQQRWTHPVVYETYKRVGPYEVRNLAEKIIFPDFQTTYEKVCSEAMMGRTFDLPQRPALTKQPPKPSTPEHASRVLQGLLDQLGPDEPKKKPDIDPNFNDEYDWEGMLKSMGIPYTKHPDGTLTTPRKPSTLRKERV